MKDSVVQWLRFAEENLACAHLVADSGYYCPALQNVQQATEKALKAVIVEKDLEFRKTHSIQELKGVLLSGGVDICLTDEDCELLDSVYLPSKYPLGGVLPDSTPDESTCRACIGIAEKVLQSVRPILDG